MSIQSKNISRRGFLGASAAVAALVIWCHRGNIQRLLTGTEKKFQWHVDPLDGGEDGPQA